MYNIIAIIFVFSLLVLIHELGHFLAAKWMGVRVERFSIGFPPKLFSRKIGETEFVISAIPLGGYVKMAGFLDESMDTNTTGAEYEFNSKPVWRRIIIISAGVVMNLFLAILILTMLNFFQGEKIISGTEIGNIMKGSMAERIGFVKYDKITSINNTPVGNWQNIGEVFLDNLNSDITFNVQRDNRELQLLYKKEWFQEEGGEQLNIIPLIPNRIGDVSTDMPAGKLGLQFGDEILAIDGTPVEDWDEMTEQIRKYPEQSVLLRWRRSGQIMTGMIEPQKFEEEDAEGNLIAVGKIGVSQYYEHRDVSFLHATQTGVVTTFNLIYLNMRGLWWVISGTKSAKEVMGGPLTIAKMAGDAAEAGWTYLWSLIAILSSVLAFFNILPIPALDGGHLFFLILEGIMRKPLSVGTRVKMQQAGMALLLFAIIFIIYVDVKRFFF